MNIPNAHIHHVARRMRRQALQDQAIRADNLRRLEQKAQAIGMRVYRDMQRLVLTEEDGTARLVAAIEERP